jgi:hypothetical protein
VFSENVEESKYLASVIFGGVGVSAKSEIDKGSDTPWSVGYIYNSERSNFFGGVDIAGEGTSLDNTSGNYNRVTQGLSFNMLAGKNLNFNQDWRAGIGVLLGVRQTAESCPASYSYSYLGYKCYADVEPDTSYDFNYGGLLHVTYKRVLAGARVTPESYQVILGLAF